MQKRDIKKAALIYCASALHSAMESGAYATHLTEKENSYFQSVVQSEASQLASKTVIGDRAKFVPHIDQCVEIIHQLYYE